MRDKRTIELLIVGILLACSSALILSHLGNIYLWGDEAETALLARAVMSHGLPLAYDGKNYISELGGKDWGEDHVWKLQPWLPFYVLAGFFAVFGQSTFVARLPFALIGIATIVLTYYYSTSLWRNRRAGFVSAVLLILCVPFLLLVRQCRYYAPAALLSLAGLYAFSGMLENRKRASSVFVLVAVLLSNTNYVSSAALLITSVVYALIWRREKLKSVALACAIAAALSLPEVVWFAGIKSSLSFVGTYASRTLLSAGYYLIELSEHVFHPALLALPAVAYVIHRARGKPVSPLSPAVQQNLPLLLLFIAVTVIVTSLTNQWHFFRYLAPSIPVACIIAARMIEPGMRVHWAVGVIVIGLLAWWWRMPDYLYEITHDFDGPTEGIVEYLNTHGSDSDIAITNHDDIPLKFYTRMRIVGLNTGEDVGPARNADWVIVRGRLLDADLEGARWLQSNIPWSEYEKITLAYPDTLYENREDPEEHIFRTSADAEPVVIYHRVVE